MKMAAQYLTTRAEPWMSMLYGTRPEHFWQSMVYYAKWKPGLM